MRGTVRIIEHEVVIEGATYRDSISGRKHARQYAAIAVQLLNHPAHRHCNRARNFALNDCAFLNEKPRRVSVLVKRSRASSIWTALTVKL